jgi:hypothetical protein
MEKTDQRLPGILSMYRCALSDEALNRLLADDVPAGDLTTESLGLRGQPGRLEFRARGAMTVCGVEEAARLFALAGASAHERVHSGASVEDETLLLTAEARRTPYTRHGRSLRPWSSGRAGSPVKPLLWSGPPRRFRSPAPAKTRRGPRRYRSRPSRRVARSCIASACPRPCWCLPNTASFSTSRPARPSLDCKPVNRRKRSWWKWSRQTRR